MTTVSDGCGLAHAARGWRLRMGNRDLAGTGWPHLPVYWPGGARHVGDASPGLRLSRGTWEGRIRVGMTVWLWAGGPSKKEEALWSSTAPSSGPGTRLW